jgi:HPt (histidine-containing phosphotransfer) domain-containing protein
VKNKITVHVDAALEPIVPRFFELKKEDVRSIGEALEKRDYETIARVGHSMKGAGAGYGFDYISEIGRNIESAGKAGNAESVKRWAEELSAYIGNVEVIYDG